MLQQKDFFTVELRSSDGRQPLPSIEYDGQRWFVGEPGREFSVAVSSSIHSGLKYQVAVKVDGQSLGYCNTYDRTLRKTAIFDGWVVNSGGKAGRTYRALKFGSCKPQQGAATVSNPDDIQAGKVVVRLRQVQDTGATKQPSIIQAGPGSAATSKKLPEGKKWFLAPGLKAEAGSILTKNSGWDTRVYKTIGTLPDLMVRYDSSEALYLRKALNPRFAPHRAILRKSAKPAIAALGAEPAATAAAGRGGSSSRQGASARVKREAGVKRERQQGEEEEEYVPRSATAADRVDLTEEPVRPMTVNGRQLAPDELAVCDLCDSDEDDAPTWQVRKKQQIEVEV